MKDKIEGYRHETTICLKPLTEYKGEEAKEDLKYDLGIYQFLKNLEERGEIKIVREFEPRPCRGKTHYIYLQKIFVKRKKGRGKLRRPRKAPWERMRCKPLKRFAGLLYAYPPSRLKMIPRPFRVEFISKVFNISKLTARDYLTLLMLLFPELIVG